MERSEFPKTVIGWLGVNAGSTPKWSVQTHSIPNSVGEATVIATDWGQQYSQYSHIPLVNIDTLVGGNILWPPCVSTGVQPTLIEKVAISGGHIGLLDEEIAVDQCLRMVPCLYPGGLVRHILRAARSHFEGNLPSASTRGMAGGITAHDFIPATMARVCGQVRLSAMLSGIAPGARTRYLTAWHHWEKFMTARQMSPRIWRTNPDWGDSLIDYIMFESKVLANAPDTISGGISGIRFWHLLVGMPDFTLGGGMCTQVLKSIRRGIRANHKIHAATEMIAYIAQQQCVEDPRTTGIACAALVGFFFLMRVGELECLRWMDVSLSTDSDGDVCLRLEFPRSKTYQYNECHINRLKGANQSAFSPFEFLGSGWV